MRAIEKLVGNRNSYLVNSLGAMGGASVFGSTIAREVMVVLSFNIILIATAQISVALPFTIVPITGQTFGVLLTAMALGRTRAVGVVGLYLLEGALGLPVFAGATGGAAVLLGPTGGYLLGFLVAAYVTGSLADRGWDRNYWLSASALTLGAAVIFVCGLSQLSLFVEPSSVLQLGFYPFLIGSGLKIAAAFWLIPMISGQFPRKS
ncbi:biotin transporter BioY [bacterium AH-315-J21]|nr:biotin transporter BioY [bacterium AH-315-J21]